MSPLPTTSLEGITGSWAPALNNTATTTYTFTPTAGQCATTNTLTITVNPIVTPTFNPVGPYCSGAAIPALPTTSLNNITGTWSPAINNTETTTYLFTPDAGQCAATSELTITIGDNVTPVFNQIGPLCQGSAAPALPNTSNNGITGSWSPAVISTATSGTYTFTPDAGQCGITATMDIVITTQITPTFTQIGPLCQGSVAPSLPNTSNNGITGTWNPATINTSTAGTSIYTFTPEAGRCATSATLSITVNPNPETPEVTVDCSLGFDHAILTVTSPTGDYQYSLDEANYQDGTSFTDIANGSHTIVARNKTTNCASSATAVDVNCGCSNPPSVTLNGNSGNTCVSTAMAISGNTFGGSTTSVTVSHNGSGTLNAAVFTATPFDIIYTPDATDAGKTVAITVNTNNPLGAPCSATSATYSFTVNPVLTPTFDPVGPFCTGASIADLPTTSLNGIIGTWSPAIDNTATTLYTFTPDADQCGDPVTLTIADCR